MFKKMKYCLSELFTSRQMRIRILALLSAMSIALTTLLGCSVNTIKIFDGEKTYSVRSLTKNFIPVIKSLNLKSNNYKILNSSVDGKITNIQIAYTFPVFITKGNETKEIQFAGGTVRQALEAANYKIDEYDFVEPSPDTVVNKTVYIDYIDIDYNEGSYIESVPQTVQTVYAPESDKGYYSFKEGSDGEQVVSYKEKLVNGVSTEKTVTGVAVVKDMVAAKKIVGTKEKVTSVNTISSENCISTLSPSSPIELDKNGVPLNYKSKSTVRATAYTYTGSNCATGVAPQPGYIAVNPKVIPYGTKMYIKSSDGRFIYGYAVAADTGGFIKNHLTGVDLFMASRSACINFGVRNVEIYILE